LTSPGRSLQLTALCDLNARHIDSSSFAGQRITGKEKRREAPSNPPLINPRHNPQAPWIPYEGWDGNSGLINERTQSGWRMIV
jgi:hypothetical protein